MTDRISYTVDEAAAATGYSAKTLRRANLAGDLPFHYPTAKPVIFRVDLETWIASAPTERRSERQTA